MMGMGGRSGMAQAQGVVGIGCEGSSFKMRVRVKV
jgi:hypothetical protein